MLKRDRKQLRNRIAVFLRHYERMAPPIAAPNDRRYDREIERIVRRMDPEELDRLIRDEDLGA